MALAFDATALVAAGTGEMTAVPIAELMVLAEEDGDTIAVGPLGIVHAYAELDPAAGRALAALVDGSEVIHIVRMEATELWEVAQLVHVGVDRAVAEAVVLARGTDVTVATYRPGAYLDHLSGDLILPLEV
jgi:hypothetical protein